MFLCYVPFSSLLSDFFCLTRARAYSLSFLPTARSFFSRVRFNWEQIAVCKNKHIIGDGVNKPEDFLHEFSHWQKEEENSSAERAEESGQHAQAFFLINNKSECVSTQRQNVFAGRFSEAFGERAKCFSEECRFCARFLFFHPTTMTNFPLDIYFHCSPAAVWAEHDVMNSQWMLAVGSHCWA